MGWTVVSFVFFFYPSDTDTEILQTKNLIPMKSEMAKR